MPDDLEFPRIPQLTEEAYHPVCALAKAALTLQRAVVDLTNGKTLDEIHDELGDWLIMTDRIVEVWSRHFELIHEDTE